MPFTPKFVDLVRNVASVQGTGPVTLGAAVSGFSGFAAAVSAGEQFYYCIQGVDRPSEREVGRGTMQANGTIARDPISGTLTNFTSGSKTIALVAAAEWFSRIDQLGAGGGAAAAPFDVATRSALAAASTTGSRPAFLCEKGREGLFLFDPSNLSAKVAADPAQGLFVAPSSAPSGASGAWVRQHDGALRLEWFGAVAGDHDSGSGADCLPAWTAAMACLAAGGRNDFGLYSGCPEVFFPGAQYYFSDTLQIKQTMRLRGLGSGYSGGAATILRFAAGKAGIVVNRYNTLGDVAEPTPTTGGDGSIIEGFYLLSESFGVAGGTPDLLKSGIRMRARAMVRDCLIGGFLGVGVCLSADTSVAASDPFYGNTNNWRLDNVRAQDCKAGGFYVSGGDANAGLATMCDASKCGRFGFRDSAFLGNSWIGCHADANGMFNVAGVAETSVVHLAGTRYYLAHGQEALAASTTPGTNGAVWVPMGAGGVHVNIPTWDGSQAYVSGGAYLQTGTANKSLFDGCYYEGGQAPPQMLGAAIVVNGFMGNGQAAGAPFLVGSLNYGLQSNRPFTQIGLYGDGTSAYHALGGDMSGAALDLLTWNSSVATPFNSNAKGALLHNKATGDITLKEPAGSEPLRVTGYSTARTYGGRAQAECRQTVEVNQLALGNGAGSGGPASLVFKHGSVAPTTGRHGLGDIVFNSNASGPAFWRCTGAGTPGTWTAVGGLSASALIGYGTGAGGTVVQAGSKSTGVALAKASGQITMNATSLAAGASVTFQLVNSFIAATDAVIVNIASGATLDSYEVAVTQVAAGSCRIQLRNISAGALAEAVVLNFAALKGASA